MMAAIGGRGRIMAGMEAHIGAADIRPDRTTNEIDIERHSG
jgi:hypothetical protein